MLGRAAYLSPRWEEAHPEEPALAPASPPVSVAAAAAAGAAARMREAWCEARTPERAAPSPHSSRGLLSPALLADAMDAGLIASDSKPSLAAPRTPNKENACQGAACGGARFSCGSCRSCRGGLSCSSCR